MGRPVTVFLAAILMCAALPCASNVEDIQGAFEKRDTEAVLKLLRDDPPLLKADLGDGLNSLHLAAYYGLPTVADYALSQGVDINSKDSRGLTALWFSISGGRPEMARKLMELGADPGVTNEVGNTLLFRAAEGGCLECVQLLLEKGLSIQQKNRFEQTVMQSAVRGGNLEIIKLLQSKGMDFKGTLPGTMTLLHDAAMGGRPEVIRYLLASGLDINAVNRSGVTPLLLAIQVGRTEAAMVLAEQGADVNRADSSGLTPFLYAVKKGQQGLVDLFLKHGAEVNRADGRTGKTPLHEAALRGYTAIAQSLVNAGADMNAKDKMGHTPLSYALKYGNTTTVEMLRKCQAEETPWESNLDDEPYLAKQLPDGAAYVWYLKHSGWAVKTRSALLIFDYWDDSPKPDRPRLANGHVDPAEFKDRRVYVFSSHEHGDHFDKQIFEWRKTAPGITYILGFPDDGKNGPVRSILPHNRQGIDGLTVTTIKANDAGAGFAVQVDGLTIFHAGDHANGSLEMPNDFSAEIDYLAGQGIKPDVAFFLNMYGCGSTNPEAFQKGIFYAVDKLGIKAVFPMHAADKEWVYADLADAVAASGRAARVGVAVNRGDRFLFEDGGLAAGKP